DLVEEGAHARRRVEREVAAELVAAEALPREQQRRPDRAAGDHDRVAVDVESAATARGRVDASDASTFDDEAPRACAGIGDSAGLPRARHVRDADVQLRRRRTAPLTDAGADATTGVAEDVVARPAERVSAPLDDRGVAPGELRRDLCDVELALDAPEEWVEVVGRHPLEREALGPRIEHARGRAKAGRG